MTSLRPIAPLLRVAMLAIACLTFALPGRVAVTLASEPAPMPAPATPDVTDMLDAPTPRQRILDDPAAGAIRVPTYRTIQQRSDRLIVELPNRLIVIAQRVTVAPVVSAQVWVKTGSIFEQEHVGAGLSHFLEHLLSGGSTATRSEDQNNALLGRIGAQTNAATSLDNVHYYINTTADHAGTAVDLLCDWMQHASITPAEYEREREVIQREFEHGAGDPGRIFWKLTQQARYADVPGHPARHPTIGYLDEFLAISRDEIYAFYKRMYVPNNMVFVVAGDIDPRAVVDQVAARFADAKPMPLPEVKLPTDPAVTQPREATGHADIRRPRVRLAWPGTVLGADGDYALDLLANVLGEGESSRLTRSLRDEQRLVNTIDAYNASFSWGEGFFGIDAEAATADADLGALMQAVLAEVRRVAEEGVAPDELARAKRQTLARVIYANQTAEGIAARLAHDVISTGDPDYLPRYAKAIQELTADDLQAAATRFLREDRLMRLTLLPLPAGGKPTELARPDEAAADTQAWRDVVLDNTVLLEKLDRAAGGATDDAAVLEVDPVKLVTLDNGLRVLIGRSTVVPAVAMQWFQLGGLLADEPGREGVASAAASMMVKGTATRSAEAISRTIEDLGAGLTTQAGSNTTYAQAMSLREDYPTVLALLADVVLNPVFPEEEWAKLQPRVLAAIDRQSDRWGGELGRHWRAAYFDGHVWSHTPLGRRDVVGALTADDLRAFHAARLSATDSILAVFGDVDPAEAEDHVRRLFAAMPAQAATPFAPSTPPPPSPKVVVAPTAKPMAAVQVGFGPGIRRQDPDYAALQVVSRWLSDFPSGQLEQALRGDGPGLVYAVGAQNITGVVPGALTVIFNTQPATVVEALSRTMQVIDKARTQPPSEEALDRAKASVRVEEAFSKQANGDRAMSYALDVLYGLPLDDTQDMLAKLASLTPAQVHAAARQYLRNPVVVVMSHTPIERTQIDAVVSKPSPPKPDSD